MLTIIGGSIAGVRVVDNRYAKAPDLAAMKQTFDTQTLYFEQKFLLDQKRDLEYTIKKLRRVERTRPLTDNEVDMLQDAEYELDNVMRQINSTQQQMDKLKQGG